MSDHHHHHGPRRAHSRTFGPSGPFPRARPPPDRDFKRRAFTVGVGGPVGSGKTALMLQLCLKLRDRLSIAAVMNDIFTEEDGEFLVKHQALDPERIRAVETGDCPHAAIRDDISANLLALEELHKPFHPDILLIESGGDKIPRKGGPGITQSDLLVINKTDLAQAVGADLKVMERDAKRMRGDGPLVFAQVKNGAGMDEITEHVLHAWQHVHGVQHSH